MQAVTSSPKVIVACGFQLLDNQCCGWTSLCGSYNDCRTTCNNYQETFRKKKKVYYLQDLGPHSEVSGRERAGEPGSGFIGVEGRDVGSMGSLFIGEFKT